MRAAAEYIVEQATDAIGTRGRCVLALSGGSTPLGVYELLASAPFATRVSWPNVHVCFSDERCVPPEDPRSNYRMAWASMLDRVPIPRAQIHRMRGEDSPSAAAESYERELRALLGTPHGAPSHDNGQRFDLVLLGLGADAHTASLFPGGDAVHETTRWAVAAAGSDDTTRVTLTPTVINSAAHVVFLVTGGEKAKALREAQESPIDVTMRPAQVVAPSRGTLRWMVDVAAAAQLRPPASDP